MLGLLLCIAIASAPAMQQPAAPAEVATAIADVEARFDEALEKRDQAALAAVLAAGFVWIHALDGRLDSRDVFLDLTARGMGLSRQRETSTTFADTLAVHSSTAIRTARIRTRFKDGTRETWMRQVRVFIRDDGQWKLASGQSTRMYDGQFTDAKLYQRYAGTYAIDAKRSLRLDWDGDALLAIYPNGTRTQLFLRSPTEEAVGGIDRLRFVLDESGTPTVVESMRGAELLWRAVRAK